MVLLVLSTIVLLIAVIWVIQKRRHLKVSELYTTSLFTIVLGLTPDLYFDLKFNLYGFFHKGVDWAYLPIFIIDYPAVNILFLNFFPFQQTSVKKMIHILGWSFGILLMEQIALHTDLFFYNGWKWWYSACLYPLIFTIMYVHLKFTRRLDSL